MTFKKTTAVAGAFATAFAVFASSASAQTAPAAAAPAPIRHGAAVPGVCFYNFERALASSDVGKAVAARINVIAKEVEVELTNEEKTLTTDIQGFDRARATMTPDAAEQRASQLTIRRNALARKLDLRQRELQATRGKALDRIEQEMSPVVIATYQARSCAVLLAGSVVTGNPQMDITDQVVAGLNAKIKTLTFNRERLDTPPPAAPAAAARP
ncbi:MAG: OmpH family outer membrane protein [Caulobacter sp.]|nr:OmpH family outer membrane protein [Caulobacter sp.]